jgi:lipopolysaccharide export system permease protein
VQAPREADETNSRAVEPVYDHASHLHITGRELQLGAEKLVGAQFDLRAPELALKLTTISSEEATYHTATTEHPNGWLLKNPIPGQSELQLTPAGENVVRAVKNTKDLFVITDISFDQLCYRSQNVQYASTTEVISRIRNPAFGTASVRGLILNLHTRLMQPLINITAAILAVPLIVRRESRGLIVNLAFCSVILGGVYLAMQASFYLGRINYIDPAVAAWTPVILSGTLSAWFFEVMQS